MKKIVVQILIAVPILILGACSLNSNQKDSNKAEVIWGSWELKEIHWKTSDTTYSIKDAQPGLLVINSNRYSIMWTPTTQPRTAFSNLSRPTDEEILAGFKTIVFNAGTYELTDTTFTTTAMIAKVPGFEGGKQFYKYAIQDTKMILTMYDETYPDGSNPEWYGTYETEFILRRVD